MAWRQLLREKGAADAQGSPPPRAKGKGKAKAGVKKPTTTRTKKEKEKGGLLQYAPAFLRKLFAR